MSEKRFKVSGHSTSQCEGVINYSVGSLSGNYPDISYEVTVKAGWYSHYAGHGIAYNGSKFAWASGTDKKPKTADVHWTSSGAGHSPYYAQTDFTFKLGKSRNVTKSISCSVSTYSPYNFNGSISAKSPSVEEPSSYYLSVSSITEKSVKISHKLSNKRNYWRVKLVDTISNKTWSLNNNTGDGTTTITGLSANKKYTFALQLLDRNDNVVDESSGKTITTLGVSKVGNSPSFTLGNSFEIKITGYDDKFTHTAKFTIGKYSFSRTGLKRGSVDITLTDDEENAVYNEFASADDMQMNISLTTYNGSTSIGSNIGKGTVKINIDEAKPIVNSFDYEDIVSAAISITGNKKHIIQNASIIKVSGIDATGRKGASIKSYQLVIGERKVSSTENTVTDVEPVPSNTGVTVKAIDTRGIEGAMTIPFDKYYIYEAPKLTKLVAHRRNRIENAVLLDMEGVFSSVTVQGVVKNTSCDVFFASKLTSAEDFGEYKKFGTFENGEINIDNVADDLDTKSSFDIRVMLRDSLCESVFGCVITKGIPDFVITKSKFGIKCIPIHDDAIDIGKSVYVNGDVYVGSNEEKVLHGHDTGWVDCTYGSGFARYGTSSDHPPAQVARQGHNVYLRGSLKRTGGVVTPSGDNDVKCLSIPAEFAPDYTIGFVCQGSSANRFYLSIKNDGSVYVSRYNDGKQSTVNGSIPTNKEIPTDAWLKFNVSWYL